MPSESKPSRLEALWVIPAVSSTNYAAFEGSGFSTAFRMMAYIPKVSANLAERFGRVL